MKLVVTPPLTMEPISFRVRLVAVERVKDEYGDHLCFQLEGTDPSAEGVTFTAWVDIRTHANSKLMQWASALNGEPFQPGDEVDFEKLIGREAKVYVDPKQLPDGRTVTRVADIVPLPYRPPSPALSEAKEATGEHTGGVSDGALFADA